MVISTITLLNTILKQTTESIGTLLIALPTVRSTYQRITLKSWFTNLEQTPLNRCQQPSAPYKRLIDNNNKADRQTIEKPNTFTNNRPTDI